MRALIVRTMCGIAAAAVVAGGMLVSARSADAAQYCYEIEHYVGDGSTEVIIINERGWKGHSKHGDWNILDNDAECPVEEVV